jgi:hypothetical protein
MTATVTIISPAPDAARLRATWQAYQVADAERSKRGLDFGKACYELRERSKVVPGGTSFRTPLNDLDIPHTTAYRWLDRYEQSIGVRPVTLEMKPVEDDPVESPQEDVISYAEPEEPARPLTRRQTAMSDARKRRFEEGLSMIGGACEAINGLDIPAIAAELTHAETNAWIEKAVAARSELTTLIRTLRGH